MIKEIRKYVASFLLISTLKILPNGNFKILYSVFIINNIKKL